MGQLTGKVALVAGAGRNNGKAISIAYAKEGANLILVAREKQDALNAVVKECESLGAKVLPLMADLSDHSQVERLVQQGLDHFGQIDVLMSCAGRRAHQDFWQISYEEWEKTFAVNLHSLFYLAKAVVPSMLTAVADRLQSRAAEIAQLVVREVGKPLVEAQGEVARGISILRFYAQSSFAAKGEIFPPSMSGLLWSERRPHGVAGLITPCSWLQICGRLKLFRFSTNGPI